VLEALAVIFTLLSKDLLMRHYTLGFYTPGSTLETCLGVSGSPEKVPVGLREILSDEAKKIMRLWTTYCLVSLIPHSFQDGNDQHAHAQA